MKTRAVPLIILLALLVLAFVGCKPQSISVEDRVALFLADVNSANWSYIYLNFHPTLTSDYDEIRNNILPDWDSVFPTDCAPYSISSLNTSDPRNVTGIMRSSKQITWPDEDILFLMAKDGDNWMIEELWLGSQLLIQ